MPKQISNAVFSFLTYASRLSIFHSDLFFFPSSASTICFQVIKVLPVQALGGRLLTMGTEP